MVCKPDILGKSSPSSGWWRGWPRSSCVSRDLLFSSSRVVYHVHEPKRLRRHGWAAPTVIALDSIVSYNVIPLLSRTTNDSITATISFCWESAYACLHCYRCKNYILKKWSNMILNTKFLVPLIHVGLCYYILSSIFCYVPFEVLLGSLVLMVCLFL